MKCLQKYAILLVLLVCLSSLNVITARGDPQKEQTSIDVGRIYESINTNPSGNIQTSLDERVIFFDDFENYSVGQFPSSGGWEILYSGAGIAQQYVSDKYSKSGNKSLRLLGTTGWSAVVMKRFSSSATIIGFEFDILFNGRGNEYADHPGFVCPNCKTWSQYWSVLFDHSNAIIYIKTDEGNMVLGSWEPKKWYHVKAIINRDTKTISVWINGVLKADNVKLPKEDWNTEDIQGIALTSAWPAQEVFYDNVRVFEKEIDTTVSFTYTIDGLRVHFTATASDPDGISSYLWDFGDGTLGTESNVTHTYKGQGEYTVTLRVTDGKGESAFASALIIVRSSIRGVSVSSPVVSGVPITAKVSLNEDSQVTLKLKDEAGSILYSDTQNCASGSILTFTVPTSNLTPGEYTVRIETSSGESYEGKVTIIGADNVEVIEDMEELRKTAITELDEVTSIAGESVSTVVVDEAIEKGAELIAKTLVDKLRTDWLLAINDKFLEELFKLEDFLKDNGVSELDITVFNEKIIYPLDGVLANFVMDDKQNKAVKDVLSNILEESAPDDWEDSLTSTMNTYITKPILYRVIASEDERAITSNISALTTQLQSNEYSQSQLEDIKRLAKLKAESIENKDTEPIFEFLWMHPTLHYFRDMTKEATDPGFYGFGKYNPVWVVKMTNAGAQAVISFIPWATEHIETNSSTQQVDSKQPQPAALPVVAVVGAVKAYMTYVNFLGKASPWIISGGSVLSADVQTERIEDEVLDFYTQVNSLTLASAFPEVTNDTILYKQGDVAIIVSPTGRIVKTASIQNDTAIKLIPGYKYASFASGEVYESPQNPNVSVSVKSLEPSYPVNGTAVINVTLTNNGDFLSDVVVWLIDSAENITIKEIIANISSGETLEKTYTYVVSNETPHVPHVFVNYYGLTLGKNYTVFTVGNNTTIEGIITEIESQLYYKPGNVSFYISLTNLGNQDMENLTLQVDVGAERFIKSTNISGNATIRVPIYLNLTVPDRYPVRVEVIHQNSVISVATAYITVTAEGTLIGTVTSDRPVYSLNDTVYLNITLLNVTTPVTNVSYTLRIITPKGDILNTTRFKATEVGTYIATVIPTVPGYRNVKGSTVFIVENQSQLIVKVMTTKNTTVIKVENEYGTPVPETVVTINGRRSVSDDLGTVEIPLTNGNITVEATKFGFVPYVETVTLTPPLKGDVNGDGRITATDALLYLRFAVGLDITPYHLDPVLDDLTGDGKITAVDALKILRMAVGLEPI